MKKTMVIALVMAFALFGCDNGNTGKGGKEQSKSQTITFGTNLSTTVTGNMTDSQWNNVIGKLTTALNAAANAGGDLGTNTAGLFALGITIELIANAAYQYYNADLVGRKISLNSGYVIGATQADLSAKVAAAIHGAAGNGPAQQ